MNERVHIKEEDMVILSFPGGKSPITGKEYVFTDEAMKRIAKAGVVYGEYGSNVNESTLYEIRRAQLEGRSPFLVNLKNVVHSITNIRKETDEDGFKIIGDVMFHDKSCHEMMMNDEAHFGMRSLLKPEHIETDGEERTIYHVDRVISFDFLPGGKKCN